MTDIPNIWLPAAAVAVAFQEIDAMKPDEFQDAWHRIIKALGALPGYSDKPDMARTKANAMQPGMLAEIKDVFKRHTVMSIPGLQFSNRPEDAAAREARLAADIDVARELFARTYGVELKIEGE